MIQSPQLIQLIICLKGITGVCGLFNEIQDPHVSRVLLPTTTLRKLSYRDRKVIQDQFRGLTFGQD